MQVRETTLQELLAGSKQLRVPLFQRTYTWKEQDHEQLWQDILEQYALLRPDEDGDAAPPSVGNHFIGSFVLAPAPSSAALPTFLIVDGQQRLTTLLLLLCALRDAAAPSVPTVRDKVTELYLINKFATGLDRPKLIPTQIDRPAFFACLNDEPTKGGGQGRIAKAYRFFSARLAELGPDDEPLALEIVERVVVSRLGIVDITAQVGDNVHRIFESLNATGVGLTQADLLRNYLFMLMPTRGEAVYDSVWRPMEENLGSENLEGLARVDLLRRGIEVRTDDIYRGQQNRLKAMEGDESAIEAEVRDLAVRAEHYGVLLRPALEPHPLIRRHLEFIDRWGAQTTYPLLMHLFELRGNRDCSDDEIAQVLLNVESFLVRRLLIGVTTKNLNRIFLRLVRELRQVPHPSVLEAVRYNLSTERKYWARDNEIETAARVRPFYYTGRAMQRRMVLERIEESYGHKELAELRTLPLTVEHIMPQSLSGEWRQSIEASGDNPDDVHGELVHTLGNLTLSAYNSELSNLPFERKQQIYSASHLDLNLQLVGEGAWGRHEILARADELVTHILEVWPAPVPGVSDSAEGFDWSPVHAAIAAIPAGRWTAYHDVAQLVGTSPIAVGNHIGGNPHLVNGHRVLTWDGIPSAGFHWSDPSDTRDVRDVLRSEGLDFDATGHARPDQRLTSGDLAELTSRELELQEVTLSTTD